jgi:anti-sigma factor RsiW
MIEKNNNNICKMITKQICEELEEDLESPFCLEVQNHLQKCPHCWAYVNSIKNTVHFCQKLIDEDVPKSIHDRLWKNLRLKNPE